MTSPVKKLVCIGDSLTDKNFNPGSGAPTVAQHWSTIFGLSIGCAAENIHTLAAGGDTTIQALSRIPDAVSLVPTDVIIMLMANDRGAIVAGTMSLATYKENLRQMVIQLHAGGMPYDRIVLASCPVWRSLVAQYTPLINAMMEVSAEFGCRFRHNFKDYLYDMYMNSAVAQSWYFGANNEDPVHQGVAGMLNLANLFYGEVEKGWFGFASPSNELTPDYIAAKAAIAAMKNALTYC